LVPGFTGTREARDEEVILAQPLDIFGLRRARAGVASAHLRRAEAEDTLAIRTLIVEIRFAATALFAAQEAERLEEEQLEAAQQLLAAARRRAELGDVPPVQVQRAELEMLRAENDLSRTRAGRLTRLAALNLLIGQEPGIPFRIASPLSAGTAAETFSLESRPDILGARATLAARQSAVRALRRERLPRVEFQARRSSFFGREGSYALRAVVTVPLWDFGSIRGEQHAAEAEARSQEAAVQLLQRQANTQLESARVRLEQGRKNAARYKEQLVPLALDLLRKAQIGYAQGANTHLEVLDAQRTLRQVRTEYLEAIVGVANSETALEAALLGGASPLENRTEILMARGEAQ
jgi:cobalt-zinc-cadmium efflux system outer membrane protein